MCPWVGPHAPSFGRQLWGLPSRVQYPSPQGVWLPLVYSTTASPLWLELPLCLAGDPLLDCVPAPLSTVASMAPGDVCYGPRCSLAGLGPVASGYRPCCWPGGPAGSPQCVRPMGCWFFPIPQSPYVCTCVRCPGPNGSCSPVCPLGALFCGVLGHLCPVHRCARSVCCFACAVSRATWLLFTGVPGRCVALRVRCPGPLGSCSPVCPRRLLCYVCGVLGHLAPVHRCARSVCCFACAVSWATWLLFTGVPDRCVVFLVRCPRPLSSCSPVCMRSLLFCLCGVLGHLAPVHRSADSVHCLCVPCPRPLGSCSPGCPLGALFCLCGVLGHLARVRPCARPVCCAASWASWLLFTVVPALCVVLWVACAGHRCGAHTSASGRQLLVTCRGLVPSGHALVHPDGGCS